jgi:hypothetical protein
MCVRSHLEFSAQRPEARVHEVQLHGGVEALRLDAVVEPEVRLEGGRVEEGGK